MQFLDYFWYVNWVWLSFGYLLSGLFFFIPVFQFGFVDWSVEVLKLFFFFLHRCQHILSKTYFLFCEMFSQMPKMLRDR